MRPLAKILTQSLVTLGLASIAMTPAFAAAPDQTSMTVSVDDLDLSTKAGQKTLNRRIEGAARTVCGANDVQTGTRIASPEARACLAKVRNQMREQVAARINGPQRGG